MASKFRVGVVVRWYRPQINARYMVKKWTPLHVAAASGTPAGRDQFFRSRRSWGAPKIPPLHRVAASGTPAVVAALLNAGADLEARNNVGSTPLHRVAASGTPAVVAALLDAGADVKKRNTEGWTPLHMAAARGTPALVEALLDAGADPSATDAEGCCPWDFAKKNPLLEGTDVYWRLHDGKYK